MDRVSLTPLPQTIALAAYAHYQLVERATVGLVGYLWFFERMPRLFYPLWARSCRRGGVPEKALEALTAGAAQRRSRDQHRGALLPPDRAPPARPRARHADAARHRRVVRDDARRGAAARRAVRHPHAPSKRRSTRAQQRYRPGRLKSRTARIRAAARRQRLSCARDLPHRRLGLRVPRVLLHAAGHDRTATAFPRMRPSDLRDSSAISRARETALHCGGVRREPLDLVSQPDLSRPTRRIATRRPRISSCSSSVAASSATTPAYPLSATPNTKRTTSSARSMTRCRREGLPRHAGDARQGFRAAHPRGRRVLGLHRQRSLSLPRNRGPLRCRAGTVRRFPRAHGRQRRQHQGRSGRRTRKPPRR